MNQPRVTFGIVNCNRLHYLKSCLESLIFTTESYKNKEIIVVDNSSVEEGTQEYLEEKESQGIIVIRTSERDPSNEFARALNTIYENSTGEYICPLQGDMQFILKGDWLERYVEYFEKRKENIGCIALDAQRRSTIARRSPYAVFDESDIEADFRFFIDPKRPPISGAADCMYSREILKKIYPWHVNNENHEGGNDSETEMLKKVESLLSQEVLKNIHFISPQTPVSIAIWTDSRGTNARVRGDKRYGDYWPAKSDYRYYKIFNIEEVIEKVEKKSPPIPIEDVAFGVGWDVPKDEEGNWLKNPIRPESASPSDWVSLCLESSDDIPDQESPDHIDEWLNG